MFTIVVPVDGSENSTRVVEVLLSHLALYKEQPAVRLLHVVRPIASGNIKHFIGHDELARYYQDEGTTALQGARTVLGSARVPYSFDVEVGEPADLIARYAADKQADLIVMGTRGVGSMSAMFMGSVAAKVVHLASAPVLLVKGGEHPDHA